MIQNPLIAHRGFPVEDLCRSPFSASDGFDEVGSVLELGPCHFDADTDILDDREDPVGEVTGFQLLVVRPRCIDGSTSGSAGSPPCPDSRRNAAIRSPGCCTGTRGSAPQRPFARHFWYRIPEISSHAGNSACSPFVRRATGGRTGNVHRTPPPPRRKVAAPVLRRPDRAARLDATRAPSAARAFPIAARSHAGDAPARCKRTPRLHAPLP